MARPSKYTPTVVKCLTQYIADGLTIRDACYGVGISADTFCRWRKEKPEFDEAIIEATRAQSWSSAALAQTSSYRRYNRKQKNKQERNKTNGINTHLDENKALLGLLRASEGHFSSQQVTNLPKRSDPPVDAFGELIWCKPYFNTTNGKVEWVEKETFGKYVLHSCRFDVWKE